MNSALRHLRPLLISIVALILTAGIAFAAKPSTPANGLAVAAAASGQTVPSVGSGDENAAPDEETETDEETEDAEDAGGDNCATDPTTLSEEDLDAMRHGSVVCWAAQQDTPSDFDNHGAWVKSWATDNAGSDASKDAGSQAKDKTSTNTHAAAGLAHKR